MTVDPSNPLTRPNATAAGARSPSSAPVSPPEPSAPRPAVPGGTVYRVETDSGDGTYEAHMSKADGTLVTVKFDKA
jgi:hypothetical protein